MESDSIVMSAQNFGKKSLSCCYFSKSWPSLLIVNSIFIVILTEILGGTLVLKIKDLKKKKTVLKLFNCSKKITLH